jgi:ribosomal protein S18 acetylase RimI-like enzyme
MTDLRKATRADLAALLDLDHRLFATTFPMSRRSVAGFIQSPRAAVIVAEDGGQFAGSAVVLFRARAAVARLYSIGVVPERGGLGIGSALLAAAEAAARDRSCRAIRLEVRESNAVAISLYEKRGWAVFGRHHHFYKDGEDALRLERVFS